jgi:hypothetical protein
VTAAYHLGPLSENETRAYIEHRLRRADWKGDPHFTEAAFPVIYQHTEGVPRRINTLCSRLLLYGFLEQLHTLTASAVDKVANDLREEIAVVTTPMTVSSDPVTSVAGDGLSVLVERLAHLEKSVGKHERLIKRAIEIAAHYFQGERL